MYGQGNAYFAPYQVPYIQGGAMPDMLNQMKMQYQQPNPVAKPQNCEMIWVLNENEATSYPVAPNNNVVLWDKNNPTIYIKSVNSQGVPSIRVLDFTERTENAETTPKKHECKCGDKFVTIEQFNALKAKFYDLLARYDEITLNAKVETAEPKAEEKPKTAKNTKKEAE